VQVMLSRRQLCQACRRADVVHGAQKLQSSCFACCWDSLQKCCVSWCEPNCTRNSEAAGAMEPPACAAAGLLLPPGI